MRNCFDTSDVVFFSGLSFVLGGLVGTVTGVTLDGGHTLRAEAIEQGLARWEIHSQAEPYPVFKWNTPDQQK